MTAGSVRGRISRLPVDERGVSVFEERFSVTVGVDGRDERPEAAALLDAPCPEDFTVEVCLAVLTAVTVRLTGREGVILGRTVCVGAEGRSCGGVCLEEERDGSTEGAAEFGEEARCDREAAEGSVLTAGAGCGLAAGVFWRL